jgi:hypothetical protein
MSLPGRPNNAIYICFMNEVGSYQEHRRTGNSNPDKILAGQLSANLTV